MRCAWDSDSAMLGSTCEEVPYGGAGGDPMGNGPPHPSATWQEVPRAQHLPEPSKSMKYRDSSTNLPILFSGYRTKPLRS